MATKLKEITVYYPNGNTETRQIEKPDLKELQKLVEGYIEFVRLPRGNGHKVMVVNEEGLLKRLQFNAKASMIARRTIVGVAVIY